MKPGFCKAHGKQFFIGTSPLIASAASADRDATSFSDSIIAVEVSSAKTQQTYYFDRQYLMKVTEKEILKPLKLLDRCKKNKQLNDRIFINKIFKREQLAYVCPLCLDIFLKCNPSS
jgi:hypothetical protein